MTQAECEEDQEIIKQLAFSVLHEESVSPALCLDSGDEDIFDDQPLEQPFNALGEFLVKYGMKNALKSEVLSINSRLVFLNVIIDFIEYHHEVNSDALEFVNDLSDQFKSTLEELDNIVGKMNQEELFYFANTYQRLSDASNHDFGGEGYELYDVDDLETYFAKFIKVMKVIVSKHPINNLQGDRASNFLDLANEAQDTLDYLIETGYPSSVFEEQRRFLRNIQAPTSQLLDQQPQNGGTIETQFQTSIDRGRIVKANASYLKAKVEGLGLKAK
jgi:hypothetical protein